MFTVREEADALLKVIVIFAVPEVAETGVYPALIKYADEQTENYKSNLGAGISNGDVRIKVKKDCRDFINQGKTEKIEFDDKTWNVASEDSVRRFLDSEFFVFYLKRTK